MYLYPSGDLSPYYLIRMTQTRHLILCSILTRDPDYVIAGKYEVRHLDAKGGQKSIQVFRLLNYFSHHSIVNLRQFAPHGVETEFGQTPFGGVTPDHFFI